ncbi:inositol monophosphatase family protein, partial [Klebsiella aerogenes]|uniref:inositol monophosphatase family protein n=2 Tax=Pseudomonadota TaxID=1224 RepID=UPI0023B79732
FGAVAPEVAGIRRLGSAALDLAWVAAGRFDGFWESNLKPWDVAAGMLLIREAGGFVTDYRGQDLARERNQYLAANDVLH